MRGNVNTRLNKLDGVEPSCKVEYDALILACAGLIRSGYGDRISLALGGNDNDEEWYHAVGQGAIAIEARHGDQFVADLLQPLCDYDTIFEIIAERSLMKKVRIEILLDAVY